MKELIKTNDFKELNIGFALDEGMASPNEEFSVFYAERAVWRMHLIKIVIKIIIYLFQLRNNFQLYRNCWTWITVSEKYSI